MKIKKLTCAKCGHEWIPRTENPKVCPNTRCHTALWDRKKKNENRA